jgi:hypothetical protein
MPLDDDVVLDRLHAVHRRFLAGYAEWGGYRFHGWTHETDKANYLGPVIWSEADCVLRFALQLEKEFPNQVHCEVKIDTSTRLDFPSDGEKTRQRVDIGVSDLSEFDGGEGAYDVFRSLHYALFAMTFDTYGHLMPGGLDEAAAATNAYLARLGERPALKLVA